MLVVLLSSNEITRLENFIAWVKILRPKYKTWWITQIGPDWFWFALHNSKTHYADEELWPMAKPIHKNKY